MEKMPENKGMDDTSAEMDKIFKERQTARLQEAFLISRLLDGLDKYLEKGTIHLDMKLGEAIEQLVARHQELVPEEEEGGKEED